MGDHCQNLSCWYCMLVEKGFDLILTFSTQMVNAGATKVSELFEDSTNITFFFENVEKAGKPNENKNPRNSKTIMKGCTVLKMFE